MKIKKWTSVILNVLVWLFIIVSAVFVFSTLSSKQNDGIPKLFGYSPMVILSDSMKGEGPQNFKTGDLVVIHSVDTSTLKKGDIITFPDIINGVKSMNTHRIIEIDTTGSIPRYTTKGDNNPTADDSKKSPNDIIGVYSFQMKGVGNVVSFFSSKWGFLLCIVLPLLLFFIWRLIKLVMAVVDYRKAQHEELSGKADTTIDKTIETSSKEDTKET